jgi:hypothetical protein
MERKPEDNSNPVGPEEGVFEREGFETRLMDEDRSEEGEHVEHVDDSLDEP